MGRSPNRFANTIGPPTVRESLQGAISPGPSLAYPDPYTHPLNDDRSLGSFRCSGSETSDRWQHLALFDGRPGSRSFRGATLAEPISLVATRLPDACRPPRYIWSPDQGRPTASLIALR